MTFIIITKKSGKCSIVSFLIVIVLLMTGCLNNTKKITSEDILKMESNYMGMIETTSDLLKLFEADKFDAIECARITLDLKDSLEIIKQQEKFSSSESLLLDKMTPELDSFEKYISDYKYEYAIVHLERFCGYLIDAKREFQKNAREYINENDLIL